MALTDSVDRGQQIVETVTTAWPPPDAIDRGQQLVETVTTAWPPPDAIDRAGRWR